MAILKKHLDLSLEEYNNMDAMLTDIPNYDVLAQYPNYDAFRKITHDLVKAMKMERCEKHIRIPDQKATIEFIKTVMSGINISDTYMTPEFLAYHARYLRRWLLNWNTTMRTFRERKPMTRVKE